MNGVEDPARDAIRSYGDDAAGRVVEYPDGDSRVTYVYDSSDRGIDVSREGPAAGRMAPFDEPSPAFAFEHDAAQGVFRLTWPDGTVEVFRDQLARQLCVEQDETDAMRPVVKRGQPACLYLAREEREVR